MNKDVLQCPNCGAPIEGLICKYCGANVSGDLVNKGVMEEEVYPLLNIDQPDFQLDGIGHSFGMAGLFIFFSLIFDILFFFSNKMVLLYMLPFMLYGLYGLIKTLSVVLKYKKVIKKGQTIYGTVYGYEGERVNDFIGNNITLDKLYELAAPVIKIKVDTFEGTKCIKYKLHSSYKPFPIGQKIKMKKLNSSYVIVDDENYHFKNQ